MASNNFNFTKYFKEIEENRKEQVEEISNSDEAYEEVIEIENSSKKQKTSLLNDRSLGNFDKPPIIINNNYSFNNIGNVNQEVTQNVDASSKIVLMKNQDIDIQTLEMVKPKKSMRNPFTLYYAYPRDNNLLRYCQICYSDNQICNERIIFRDEADLQKHHATACERHI